MGHALRLVAVGVAVFLLIVPFIIWGVDALFVAIQPPQSLKGTEDPVADFQNARRNSSQSFMPVLRMSLILGITTLISTGAIWGYTLYLGNEGFGGEVRRIFAHRTPCGSREEEFAERIDKMPGQ